MKRPLKVWLVAVGALATTNLLLNRQHNGLTFSENTRELFHVDTPEGAALFSACLDAGVAWFRGHILDGASA